LYAEAAPLLAVDEPLLVRGKVSVQDEEVSVRAESLRSLSQFRAEKAKKLTLPLERALPEESLRTLVGLLSQHRGDCALRLEIAAANGARVTLNPGLAIKPSDDLMDELEQILPGVPFRFDYPPESTRPARRNGGGASGGRAVAASKGRAMVKAVTVEEEEESDRRS
jgi:hypothetical protein